MAVNLLRHKVNALLFKRKMTNMNFFNKQPFGLYCFFLLSMLVFPVVIGNTQGGINFSYSTLESIKKQASEQKAFAFIHTTSGNCQTCERLAQNVYPDAKVGSLTIPIF